MLEGRYQNQLVAVKQIHQGILVNSPVIKEFRREIGIMAGVKHPNLVRFIAAVFDDNVTQLMETPLLVLEYRIFVQLIREAESNTKVLKFPSFVM